MSGGGRPDWYRPTTTRHWQRAAKWRSSQGPPTVSIRVNAGVAKRVQRGGSFLCTDSTAAATFRVDAAKATLTPNPITSGSAVCTALKSGSCRVSAPPIVTPHGVNWSRSFDGRFASRLTGPRKTMYGMITRAIATTRVEPDGVRAAPGVGRRGPWRPLSRRCFGLTSSLPQQFRAVRRTG